ncbi:DUF6438 domain-containing protein [Sphingomonas guangdongensis]|uniref:DUF6438 domain-containing protein n=1 Tax=Sphingomonas guangdongensis TaxID=1141890 RepID=UPI0024820E20|nr:DUF6438 domain-containing protein [Sphingomonas guangdongensis]
MTYSTGPCFGSCPVYSVTVSPSGAARFTGIRFTAAVGEHTLSMTPAQAQAFAARLLPLLPASGVTRYQPGEANCPGAPTDMPSVQVRVNGAERGIDFYYGCARDNPRVADALRAAPDLLPLAALIGDRAAFAGQR